MRDFPFFGYSTKRSYPNARKPTQSTNIYSFIQRLNLQNSIVTQVMARIWHNSRPRKVGTLIWLTLNRGLSVGTWLQCMGILPTCKVCTEEAPESLQHCLLECPFTKQAWEAFYYVWQKWGVPNDVTLSWLFVMLGEIVFEREDDPPGVQGYHVEGFSYIRQSFDILCSFILYFLWSERCRKHFDNQYSSRKILQQAWVAIVEVGMATWKAINSLRSTREPNIQARIDQAFRTESCHLGTFGDDCATIGWRFLPPLYFLNFFNA